jgi:hypothetical protein
MVIDQQLTAEAPAASPARAPEAEVATAPDIATAPLPARWFERVGIWAPSLLLGIASLVMVYAYLATPVLEGNRGLTNLTESYGALERVALWQRAFSWLPGGHNDGTFFRLPPMAITWLARVSMVSMFVAQAWAFWLAWRGSTRSSVWAWLVGPLVAHVVMILLVPSNADVFFYEMTGDLAVSGVNPYVHPLMDFPTNPLLPYNHWIEMTAVYGPVWTTVNAAIMAVTGPDPVAATIAYKIVLGIVALALAGLVYWFVRSMTRSAGLATTACVLVAWQPNMIIESTGQAHNDHLMLLLSTAGIFLAIAGGTRAIRGGLVLITLSALVKYVTLPLLGLLGLIRLVDRQRRRGQAGILGSWLLDGVAIVAVVFAAFAPYWAGFGTLTEMFLEPGRLYTNPIWFDSYMLLDLLFPQEVARIFADVTRSGMQLLAIGIILILVCRFAMRMWRLGEHPAEEGSPPAWTGDLLTGWAVVLTTLALLPVNSHPWYWTWPIVPIAVLTSFNARPIAGEAVTATPSLPRWFWAYLILTGVMTLAYHTRIVHL